MAAGLGFKTFNTGDILSASDTNGYLMQGVLVFADATARNAAITSPQEGQFAYLKDTNVTTYYTGSAWANLDTTGMTNPMTTTGDTIYSSSGSTPARLGIGSTGNVLTVAGGVPTWAAPAAGGMTLLSTTTLSGTSTLISSVNQTYNNLFIIIKNIDVSSGTNAYVRIEPNSTTNAVSYSNQIATGGTISTQGDATFPGIPLMGSEYAASNTNNAWALEVYNYASTSSHKPFNLAGAFVVNSTNAIQSLNSSGSYRSNTEITEFRVYSGSGSVSFNGGTVLIYGVK
jgi:hypothetical protein